MADLTNMYRLSQQYKTLYEDLSASLNMLGNAINSSENLEKVNDYVNIDDLPTGKLDFKSDRDKLIGYYNDLQNNILPKLLEDLRSVNADIEVAEAIDNTPVVTVQQKQEPVRPSVTTYISSGN